VILSRNAGSVRFSISRIKITATYPDGRPGEIFLDAGKSGTDIQNYAHDAAVLASLAFQHGCSVETLRHAMTRNPDGSASGPIGVLLDDLARDERR
jgi:hypothetical protein